MIFLLLIEDYRFIYIMHYVHAKIPTSFGNFIWKVWLLKPIYTFFFIRKLNFGFSLSVPYFQTSFSENIVTLPPKISHKDASLSVLFHSVCLIFQNTSLLSEFPENSESNPLKSQPQVPYKVVPYKKACMIAYTGDADSIT